MKNLLIILAIISLFGCRSKKSLYEKELIGAEIEKVSVVEKQIDEVKKSDSTIKKTEVKEDKKTNTNLHVVFDPKKNDSLDVTHIFGSDSLRLKINGNGLVIFDFNSSNEKKSTEINQVFGSETLYNIKSKAKEKTKESSEIVSVKTEVKTNSKGFTLPIYFIIGGSILLLILLIFLWKKFGGIMERLLNKNGKNL